MRFFWAAILVLSLLLVGCSSDPSLATITSKDGDSCLAENKCKMIVRVWQHTPNAGDNKDGANIYYRCLVPSSFHEITKVEDKVVIQLDDNKNCEKLNP